jgi:DNA-binding transcriptional ArsR family regulator
MKILARPAISDIKLEMVLYVLGDKNRLQIVRNLHVADGVPLNCNEAVEGIVDMPQSTCSYNFRLLREAGLVITEKKGREAMNTLRKAEIDQAFPGLLDTVLKLS